MWGRLPTCGRLPIGLVDLRRLGRVVSDFSTLSPWAFGPQNFTKNCGRHVGRVANLRTPDLSP
jgi:hypothetical protein